MNLKKILITFSLILLVSFTIGCEKEISAEDNKAEREVAESWANEIIDSAKYKYMDSIFEDEKITSGTVIDLELSEKNPVTSGTWYIDNVTKNVIIKDVVINEYICNSINPENDREIECKRK